jgi:hypothetical protein
MKFLRFGCVLMLCLVLTGCEKRIEYAIANDGSETVDDVVVKIDSGHSFAHGIIIPGAHTSFAGGVALHKTNLFTISWRDTSGKMHEEKISVTEGELRDKRRCRIAITSAMKLQKGWRAP